MTRKNGNAEIGPTFPMSLYGPLYWQRLPLEKPVSLSVAVRETGIPLAKIRTKIREGAYRRAYVEIEMPTPQGSYLRSVEGVYIGLKGVEREEVEKENIRRLSECLDLFLNYLTQVAYEMGLSNWNFKVRMIGEEECLAAKRLPIPRDNDFAQCECLPGQMVAIVYLDMRFFLMRAEDHQEVLVQALQECLICSQRALLHLISMKKDDAKAINSAFDSVKVTFARTMSRHVSRPDESVLNEDIWFGRCAGTAEWI